MAWAHAILVTDSYIDYTPTEKPHELIVTRPKKSGSVQSFVPDSSLWAAPATTISGSRCSSPPGGWHALACGARSQSTSSFLRSAAGAAHAAVRYLSKAADASAALATCVESTSESGVREI